MDPKEASDPQSLQYAREALQRSYAQLEQKVAERTAELQKAVEQLEATNCEIETQNQELIRVQSELQRELGERTRAEDALRESEEKFRCLFDNSPSAVFLTIPDGSVVAANPAACAMFQMPEEDLCRLGRSGILDTDDPRVASGVDERRRTGRLTNWEQTAIRKDGERFPVEVDSVILPGEPARSFVIVRDVTQRKRAEQALQESEQRFRALADGTPVIIWITDTHGKIEFANRALSEYFGVSIKELQSRGWQPLVHPDDSAHYTDFFNECLRERRAFRTAGRVRRADGQWRWIDAYGQPRVSETGEFLGIAGSCIDITDRIEAELAAQAYAERIEQSNKDLEEFAYVASHDLQEPLRKILAFGKLLKNNCGANLSEQGSDYIDRMQNAAERMRVMIEDLLAYSRATTVKQPFQMIDLNISAGEVLDVLETRIAQTKGRVEAGTLPEIEADPLQMRQLFQNLIGNALKFHKPDVAPVVKFGLKASSPDQLVLFVEDNGIGFEMQNLEIIFQPFRRLHGRGQFEGSGIGLAICRKIVERHRGSITAVSKPGEGSIFLVTLPVRQV